MEKAALSARTESVTTSRITFVHAAALHAERKLNGSSKLNGNSKHKQSEIEYLKRQVARFEQEPGESKS